LIRRGLLVEPEGFFPATESLPAPTQPPLIAIRACDLPDELERLLRSLLAHDARHGASRRYLVIDDTTDADSARRCAALCADFARATTSTVHRLGPEHRGAVLAALSRDLDADARHTLAQLIDPAYPTAVTGARGYNLAMLAAAGGAVSLLDHDTCLPLRQPPGATRALDLRDSTRNETGYLDDADFATLTEYGDDAFATFAARLGQSAPDMIARHGLDRAALAGRSARELMHLRQGPRVHGVFGGVYGGIAFNSAWVLSASDNDSLARLLRAPFRADRLEGDRVWHGTVRPRLTSYAVYSPLMLDARELLPFTGTWGRVDDTYFLALLGALAPRACYEFAPVLLGHFPPGSRQRKANAERPLLLDHNALLAASFDEHGRQLRSGARDTRLRAIAAICADRAQADDATLDAVISRWREGQIANAVDRLDSALATHPQAPTAWREHVARAIAVNRAAAADRSVPAPDRAAIRAAFAQAASAGDFWPQVWHAARERPLLEHLVTPIAR
jgi:hypothetical protein